jgi:holliday junction DNA helicase RuvA
MITYLRGTLAHKGELLTGGIYFVVDVNGVGYQVHTSTISFRQAPPMNDDIKVFTSLLVREDAMQLVGFLTKEERDLFDILVAASGVGFKVALSLMSQLSVSELASAIMAGDHKRLTAAKGVGPKLAQKIAIELKEKMSKWRDEKIDEEMLATSSTMIPPTRSVQEAETVLLSLGYHLQEIHQGLQALQSAEKNLEQLSSEEVLQRVLKWLATHPVQ